NPRVFWLGSDARSGRIFELALAGDALERLVGVLDAVLEVGSIRGQQLYHLVAAVGHHVADRAGREVDGRSDLKPVFFQRHSPQLERRDSSCVEPRSSPIAAQYSSRSFVSPQKIRLSAGFWLSF